ncbi:hypothetical protein [Spiroplasma poulsonii]|uniref:hypothetical protein n=2 Tax=Spiroplasma TaxID=2132 RepID=UPI000591DCA8|nr:hypothetical protein [Spiroplasma poulsonii]PWF96642.1 putative ABC transporter ATP-binding protein YbbL [Spiroplasma poulsonii]PWF97218.1 putative ABC transporter ATP-binding protein YbbL [Spiroplasma poulsonii]
MLEILAKLRPVSGGEVMLNGQFDLTMLSEEAIRTKILLFHQNDFLFTGSVYDNIINFQQNCNYQVLALLQSCDVYLIDEVLSNVDYESKMILLKLLFTLKSEQMIIYAGHDHLVEQFFVNVIDLTKLNLIGADNE